MCRQQAVRRSPIRCGGSGKEGKCSAIIVNRKRRAFRHLCNSVLQYLVFTAENSVGSAQASQWRRKSRWPRQIMQNPLTPLRFIQRASAVHPDRTAIIDGTRSFTYAAMAAQVVRLANALKARGLRPGDRVAYLAPNCAEVLVGHFAVPLAGGVLVTINTRLSPEEIAGIVEHSGAVFLLADAPLVEPARATLAAITTLREVISLPAENGREVELAFTTGYLELLAARQRLPDRPLGGGRGRCDQPELHVGHDGPAEGCRLHPPRRLPQLTRRGLSTSDSSTGPRTCGRCRCSTATGGAPRGR